MEQLQGQTFETIDELEQWLSENHQTERELWVRQFKKHSGRTSVNWEDCVIAAITWGWIDSQRKSLDDVSFLQRLSPRRSKSNWSKRNREHAERLIAEGRMQPAGLKHVQAAQEDGRWDRAYAGSAEMVVPDDFLAELKKSPTAQRRYEKLDRAALFQIYQRVQTAKTRGKMIANIIARLERG